MNLLLDTNVLSKIIRGRTLSYRHGAARSLSSGDFHHTSVVVYFELKFGVQNSPDPVSALEKLQMMLGNISEIHDFTQQDADIASELRVDLTRKGQLIGEYDILIAAQALRLGFVLVTNNLKHFNRISSLKTIDWA